MTLRRIILVVTCIWLGVAQLATVEAAGFVNGLWVRPIAYQASVIQEEAARYKQMGFTDVFLETYYLGKTAYPSDVMAKYGLRKQHAQFRDTDVITLWLQAAHKEGLKLHLWMQTFYAGNQVEFLDEEPYGPILTNYPQWANRPFFTVSNTKKNPIASKVEAGHYFLDPANPEVQQFVKALLEEVVKRYPEMDGLQLDYIRYPSALPVSNPSYAQSTWGYTESAWKEWLSLPEVKSKVASLPSAQRLNHWQSLTPLHPLWLSWVNYRKTKVSQLVQWTSALVAKQPNAPKLSTVIFHTSEPTKAQKCQDYSSWLKNGWVTALVPIGLSDNASLLEAQLTHLTSETQKSRIWVGNFDLYNRRGIEVMTNNLTRVQ